MDYNDKVKTRVKELLGCKHTEAANVTRMLHAKTKIENGDFGGALESLLEMVVRIYGIPEVKYNDDLTRLLNTCISGKEKNQTIRECIAGRGKE